MKHRVRLTSTKTKGPQTNSGTVFSRNTLFPSYFIIVVTDLWTPAFRDKLPGRAIDEAVYGIRIRYLFKEKQPKRAISLALDMCRRWEDKPQRLTEQLDLILLRLVAVPGAHTR